MKRLLLAAVAALGFFPMAQAQSRSLSGFLAQCTAVAAGSCTEQTATGYARQPIAFSNVNGGQAVEAVPYAYAQAVTGNIAGHAVYDALTGGNLLAVIPYAAAYSIPVIGDRQDVGGLRFSVTAAANLPDGEAFNAAYASGATIGTTPDGSTVTAGTTLLFQHGNGYASFGDADPSTRQTTQTTGFTYSTPSGVTSLNIKGAGTLAAGTVTLPVPQIDGSLFKLTCSITVTTLTMNPGAGATITGTAPTTCGANTSHELQYFAGDATWHVLF